MSTINARDPKLTLRLERALQAMEKRAEECLSIRRFANVYASAGTLAEMQAWCDEFNGGSCHLLPGTVERVKRELGIVSERPAAKAATDRKLLPAKPGVPELRAPRAPKLTSASAPVVPPPAPAKKEPPKSEPWLDYARRPHRDSLERQVPRLAAIAAGASPANTTVVGWDTFSAKWFRTATPTAWQAQRFLEWVAAAPVAPARPVKARKSPAPTLVESAPPKRGRGRPRQLAPKPPAKVAAPEAAPLAGKQPAEGGAVDRAAVVVEEHGWARLRVRLGHAPGYAARYTGTGVKNTVLAFTKEASAQLRPGGERTRVALLRHPVTRALAVVRDPQGLALREMRHGALRVVCQSLPTLLGAKACSYRLGRMAGAPAGTLAVFEEVVS